MKKFILSGSVVVAFVLYAVLGQNRTKDNTQPLTQTTTSKTVSDYTHLSAGQYRDGNYTGSIADAYYGNIQVKALIKNGKLIDIQFLQYPNDRPSSTEISNQSLPQLKKEAIQSQNAQVDIVSGATQTSQAFQESLQNALQQART